MSQHLANYSNKKSARVISNSDLAEFKANAVKKIPQNLCNTVLEEKSREEQNTEESIFSLKSPDIAQQKDNNQNYIMVQNQEKVDTSILMLEGVVDSLLKEQQQLKNKLNDQEKILTQFKKKENIDEPMQDLTSANPLQTSCDIKIKRKSLQSSRKKLFQVAENSERKVTKHIHPNVGPIKIKVKSTPKKKKIRQIPQDDEPTRNFATHRGSTKATIGNSDKKFLDKAIKLVNNNHNFTNKSIGREKIGLQNKIKLCEPQYESDFNHRITQGPKRKLINNKEIINETLQRRSVRNVNEISDFSNKFATVDQRQEMESMHLETSIRKAEHSLENRRKLYSSVQGVNLPKINMKRTVENTPGIRKSASYVTKPSCKYPTFT